MKYVIGIDSGGTNYRLRAASLDGTILGSYVGRPASIYSLENDELIERIGANIDALLETFGGRKEDALYILCGTTGADSDEDVEQIHRVYSSLPGFDCPVRILNDVQLAHYAVIGGPGVLIISGTGTIAYAVDAEGNEVRSGGWLFSILGDEGSGAWVSRMALRQLGRFYDGILPRSPLISKVEETLEIQGRDGLNQVASAMAKRPWRTPKLGQLVDEAALEGDDIAIMILTKAAEESFAVMKDAVDALQLDKKDPCFKLGLWGSNLLKSPVLKKRFLELTQAHYPSAKVLYPARESIDGAVELAINEARQLQVQE